MMCRLSLDQNALDRVLSETLGILREGGIVAYPTESFYALGVSVHNETAVRKLYNLKKRPLEKAVPVIVGSVAVLQTIVRSVPDGAKRLMDEFWPGPLTILFDIGGHVPALVTGGTTRIAARIPGEGFALDLARAAGVPITATSANPSGKEPACDPAQLSLYFQQGIDMIIDGGRTPGGKPSTIIDVTVSPPRIIREGRISSDLLI